MTSEPAALPDLRRVVTGHDSSGVAIVRSDDLTQASAMWRGIKFGPLWTSQSVPTDDNNSDVDGATRALNGDMGIVMRDGVTLRYTDLAPGASAALHRTSSLDHNILITGKLVLVMEDGSETLLQTPGDVVVQRGTLHAWRNPGPGRVRE
ncbi:hypothetical protein A0H81_01063 [Grifola frondosa]|uniref:Cupin 2 conserved barrel domain-containing protein n=1 Tax=Grifola frondosa TaxID=5627 RepID=A0A1C7MQG1_GRIFR|nr:hypothetical protein A0H81_01063 [Grifola frondosa]